MTIAQQTPLNNYLGDGVNPLFPFTWRILANGDLEAYVSFVRVREGTDYDLENITELGGDVVFRPEFIPGPGIPVVLIRNTPESQNTDYEPFDAFPAETHELALDKLTMMAQENILKFGSGLPFNFAGRYWDAGGFNIKHMQQPFADDDAATKRYVDIALGAEGGFNPDADYNTTGDWNNTGDWHFTGILRLDGVDVATVDDIPIVPDPDLKADKTVAIISSDEQLMEVDSPTLADDISLEFIINAPNALVKLNEQGIVPPAQLPPPTGGLVYLGTWDASVGTLPPEVIVGGFYIISVAGTISVIPPGDTLPVSTPVDVGDFIIYDDDPIGWHWIPVVATPQPAELITFDNTRAPAGRQFVSEDVQAVLDEIAEDYPALARVETVTGEWNFANGLFSAGDQVAVLTDLPDLSDFTQRDEDESIQGNWSFAQVTLVGSRWPADLGATEQLLATDGAGILFWRTVDIDPGMQPSGDYTITGNWEWERNLVIGNNFALQARETGSAIRFLARISASNQVILATTGLTGGLPTRIDSDSPPGWFDGAAQRPFIYVDIDETITAVWTFNQRIQTQEGINLPNTKVIQVQDSGATSHNILSMDSANDLQFGGPSIPGEFVLAGNALIRMRLGGLTVATMTPTLFHVINDFRADGAGQINGSWTFSQIINGTTSGNLVAADIANFTDATVDETITGLWVFAASLNANGGIIIPNGVSYGGRTLDATAHTMLRMAPVDVVQVGNSALPTDLLNNGDLRLNGAPINDDNGLIRLTAAGKVPASLLPFSALELQGTFDASSGSNPADGVDGGEFYVINVAGTLTIFTSDNGTPVATPVEPGDYLLWLNSPTVMVSGWYLVRREAPVFIDADNVTYDPSIAAWVQTTVQDVLDEISARATLRDRNETIAAVWSFSGQTNFDFVSIWANNQSIRFRQLGGASVFAITMNTSDQLVWGNATTTSLAQGPWTFFGAVSFRVGSDGVFIYDSTGTVGRKESHPGGNDFISEFIGTPNWNITGLTTASVSGVWTFSTQPVFVSGALLANDQGLRGRNAVNSSDRLLVHISSSDNVILGNVGNPTRVDSAQVPTWNDDVTERFFLFAEHPAARNITGEWTFTAQPNFNAGLLLANNQAVRGLDFGGLPHALMFVDPSDTLIIGAASFGNTARGTWTFQSVARFNNTVILKGASGHVGAMFTVDSDQANGPYMTWLRAGVAFADMGSGGQLGGGYDVTAFGIAARAGINLEFGAGSNGGSPSLRVVTNALGGALVSDRVGNFKKAGFRNPTPRALTVSRDITQDDEGEILYAAAGGLTYTLRDGIEEGTTVRLIANNAAVLLEEGPGISIAWMDGGGASAPNGDRTIAHSGVVEIWYRSPTVVIIFGNGIS